MAVILWSPFHSGVQTVDRDLTPGSLAGVTRQPGLWAAAGAGWGLLLLSSLSLLCLCPLPCFLPAGPHPCPLPAGLQQQSLVHDVLHALLAGTPAPAQRHATFSAAPFPTVREAAEELQPARCLCAWGAQGAVGFVPGSCRGLSVLGGSGSKACGVSPTVCSAVAAEHLTRSLGQPGGEYISSTLQTRTRRL